MKYFLTVLFIMSLLSLHAQVKVSKDTLHWNVNRPLQWADFMGEPTEGGSLHGQVMCVNLAGFQRQSAHHKIQFKIVSVFDRLNSWMPKDEQTDVGLNYFQVMFNIYELHARKMRKAFADSRSAENPDAEFQTRYSNSGIERGTELNQFKKETKMGLDSTAIESWRLKIDEELKALEAFQK